MGGATGWPARGGAREGRAAAGASGSPYTAPVTAQNGSATASQRAAAAAAAAPAPLRSASRPRSLGVERCPGTARSCSRMSTPVRPAASPPHIQYMWTFKRQNVKRLHDERPSIVRSFKQMPTPVTPTQVRN